MSDLHLLYLLTISGLPTFCLFQHPSNSALLKNQNTNNQQLTKDTESYILLIQKQTNKQFCWSQNQFESC